MNDVAACGQARDVFDAFLDVLPAQRAFAASLASRPTARARAADDEIWIRLAPAPREALPAETTAQGRLHVRGHGVWYGGLDRLRYVLEGSTLCGGEEEESSRSCEVEGFPGGLLSLFGAGCHDQDIGARRAPEEELCVELLLATSEGGPYVRSGLFLASSAEGWRAVFASPAWTAADISFAEAQPARARLTIGRIVLSVDELAALAPGDLLLPDCSGFEKNGACRLVLGGMEQAYRVSAWKAERRLSVDPNSRPVACRRMAEEGGADVEIDIVVGRVMVRTLDLLRPEQAVQRFDVGHTLPAVALMRGGVTVAAGELVQSDVGLVVEVTRKEGCV